DRERVRARRGRAAARRAYRRGTPPIGAPAGRRRESALRRQRLHGPRVIRGPRAPAGGGRAARPTAWRTDGGEHPERSRALRGWTAALRRRGRRERGGGVRSVGGGERHPHSD